MALATEDEVVVEADLVIEAVEVVVEVSIIPVGDVEF